MSEYNLLELRSEEDKKLFNLLLKKHHPQGPIPGSGLGEGLRFFVLEQGGFWVAGALIHRPGQFARMFKKYNVPADTGYFLRRICSFAPGEHAVALLELLADKLRKEGKHAIMTLCFPHHSGALYKHAGFEEVGVTRTGMKVFVKWLRKTQRRKSIQLNKVNSTEEE